MLFTFTECYIYKYLYFCLRSTFTVSCVNSISDLVATDDPSVAFKDVDAAFMVGAMPRREGMERKDLLKANVKIFKAQGQAMDSLAKKSVKVSKLKILHLYLYIYAQTILKENSSCCLKLENASITL